MEFTTGRFYLRKVLFPTIFDTAPLSAHIVSRKTPPSVAENNNEQSVTRLLFGEFQVSFRPSLFVNYQTTSYVPLMGIPYILHSLKQKCSVPFALCGGHNQIGTICFTEVDWDASIGWHKLWPGLLFELS